MIISTLTFGIGYFYVYGAYKQNTDDLKVCVDAYNNLSWQYYYNCSVKDNYSINYSSLYVPYEEDLYWNLSTQDFVQTCKTEMKITYHFTALEGGYAYYTVCYRCSDLNQSIMPGKINKGDWLCPA